MTTILSNRQGSVIIRTCWVDGIPVLAVIPYQWLSADDIWSADINRLRVEVKARPVIVSHPRMSAAVVIKIGQGDTLRLILNDGDCFATAVVGTPAPFAEIPLHASGNSWVGGAEDRQRGSI